MKNKKPNIILIISDQHNTSKEAETPNLDSLAKQGTNFTECYCSSPLCVPSRSGMLSVDIFPSVLECLGTKPKPEDTRLPGHSLWEYAKGKETNRAIFCESHAFAYKHAVYMLRYGNYKLVYYVDGKPQLFNIEEDPMELNDLSDDVAYLPVIDDLTKRLVELCNPEEIDAQALDEQKMLLGLYGGADAILMNKNKFFYPYSTIPDGI